MRHLLYILAFTAGALLLYLSLAPEGSFEGQIYGTSDMYELEQIRKRPKFKASDMYTGPPTVTDTEELTEIVNSAIDDIINLPQPLRRHRVLQRLKKLNRAVFLYDTEDREKAYTYTVLIWRAAGFGDDTGLFHNGDERVLELDLDYQLTK